MNGGIFICSGLFVCFIAFCIKVIEVKKRREQEQRTGKKEVIERETEIRRKD